MDAETAFKKLEGTSELEDQIHKAVERALDHKPPVGESAIAVGEILHASLPPELQKEFSIENGGALELNQLNIQFQTLFDKDNDGTISATEILNTARKVGDIMDESKVNLKWAQVVIAGILGEKDADGNMLLDPNAHLSFSHFAQSVASQRNTRGTDLASVSARARYCLQGAGDAEDVADPDSDEDDEGGQEDGGKLSEFGFDASEAAKDEDVSKWMYPVVVPDGAVAGTVLTVPMPGNEIAYAPVTGDKKPGDTIFLPMSEVSVRATIKTASLAAAGAKSLAADEEDARRLTSDTRRTSSVAPRAPSMLGSFLRSSSMSAMEVDTYKPVKPLVQPGPGALYCEKRGRNFFCSNMFLSLREAASRVADLPPLEGWMLKRGNKIAKGSLNSWRLRYFRQEGPELVYYKEKPGDAKAESNIHIRVAGQAKKEAAFQSAAKGVSTDDFFE